MTAPVSLPAGVNPDEYRKALLLERARRHLIPFVTYTMPEYHVSRAHDFLAGELEQFERDVRDKKSPRLMIELQPRFGKSELTTRRFPSWVLGRNPDWSVGLVSYGAELAEELSADARRIVLSDEYREIFGSTYQPEKGSSVEIDRSSTAVNNWRIAGHRGGVRAVGVGGALTGRGFHILGLDDTLKGREEADSQLERDRLWRWYQGTLRTRLEPGGGILIANTRWHHDDLCGRLRETQPGQWNILSLPALAEEDDPLGRAPGEALDPNRFDLEALKALRSDIGERDWWAQYMGKPTPETGDLFDVGWFVREPLPEGGRGPVFQYWDTSHGKSDAARKKRKGDYSVCGTYRIEGNKYRLIHMLRARLSYPELKKAAVELRRAHNAAAVIVEDASSGQSLIQDLRNETRIPVLGWKVGNESKVERAKAVSPIVQAGRLVISLPAEQSETFIREHLQFPSGKHDDIVDMNSMALAHLDIWNAKSRRTTRLRRFEVVAA